MCDARDVALAHLRAVQVEAAKGQRYLIVRAGHKYHCHNTLSEIFNFIASVFG